MTCSDDWMAMQYVLGELPDAERAMFEERMADDLAVCEAVTRASRLVLTARAAMSPPETIQSVPAIQSQANRSWLAFVATSVAVALLCVFAFRVPVTRDTSVAAVDPAAELVSLWRSGMSAADADQDEPDELADAAGDVGVPTWMLAAVSLEVDGQPDKIREN